MLHFLKKWGVSTAAFLLVVGSGLSDGNSLSEARLIRKVYLDFLKCPPTPTELEWFLVYNINSYEVAVDWICSSSSNSNLKEYLLSDRYKSQTTKLNKEEIENIIRYQCGKKTGNVDLLFITLAMKAGEDNPLSSIDYMATCLMSRETTTSEANYYLGIYRKHQTPIDGYLAVLKELKQNQEVIYK